MAATQQQEPPRGGSMLTRKLGPLPVWGWGASLLVVLALVVYEYRKQSSSSTSSTSGTASGNSNLTPPTIIQNQLYPPQDTDTGTPAPAPTPTPVPKPKGKDEQEGAVAKRKEQQLHKKNPRRAYEVKSHVIHPRHKPGHPKPRPVDRPPAKAGA